MFGTDLAYRATRACYAMPGTDLASRTTSCYEKYAIPGTDFAYGATSTGSFKGIWAAGDWTTATQRASAPPPRNLTPKLRNQTPKKNRKTFNVSKGFQIANVALCDVVCRTDVGYAATVSSMRSLRDPGTAVRYAAMLPGTDIRYAPTFPGTDMRYAATLPGTDKRYAATFPGTDARYTATFPSTDIRYAPTLPRY
eukprot:3287107-Rhodomonas_salina.1